MIVIIFLIFAKHRGNNGLAPWNNSFIPKVTVSLMGKEHNKYYFIDSWSELHKVTYEYLGKCTYETLGRSIGKIHFLI